MESEETNTSTSSSTITEYIYEDEILPEIEIRETVSIDSFLNDNPRFVALNKESIYTYLTQFFNTSKSLGILDLHTHIINDSSISLDTNIFVHVDGVRKNLEDISKWFDAYKEAQKAPTFKLKELLIAKLIYPFDKNRATTTAIDKQCILDEPYNIVLDVKEKGSLIDISKVLEHDSIEFPILGVYWKIYKQTPYTYIYESNVLFTPFKYIEWNINRPCTDLNKWIQKYVQPKFIDSLNFIQSIDSLRNYAICLYHNGFDIYNLSILQNKLLEKHLQKLLEDTDKDFKDTKNQKYPKIELTFPILSFIETMSKYFDLHTHQQEDKLYKFQSLIGSYIASLPNFQNDSQFVEPYTLFMQVIQATRTLEEIQSDISQLRIRDNYKKADSLLKEISASKTFVVLKDSIELYKKITQSIIDDKQYSFITLYNDMNDFKIGNDTSKYDGKPKMFQDTVYQENQYEEYVSFDEEESTPEEDGIDGIPDTYGDDFPALSELHNGIKDVLLFILPYIIKIKESSGLPWDINSWIRIYSSETQLKSRADAIREVIPEINSAILQRICGNSLDISMQIINDLNTIDLGNKLRSIYPKIYTDWQNSCKNAFYDGITMYILDSFESSVNGTLDFSIFNGMIAFADIWSPYGYPLDEKKSTVGILFYICNVATIHFPFTETPVQHTVIEEKTLTLATTKYILRLQKLQQIWNTKKTTLKQDNATQAKEALIDVTKRLLAKEKVNFMSTYVKAYYYLPTFIPKKDLIAFKKQPVWAQGCCLSSLDKNYTADNDWKQHIKPLWNMKNKLAEDRWLTNKRDDLTLFTSKIKQQKTKTNSKPNLKLPTEYFKAESINNMYVKQQCLIELPSSNVKISFDANDIWIQKTHYDIVDKNARDGAFQLASQCIKLAYRSSAKSDKILKVLADLIQLSDINHILLRLFQNINNKLETFKNTSNEYKILESTMSILHIMKDIITTFTKASGNEYIECVYKSRYILARAICLPGIIENNKLTKPDNVTASFYENILQENYNIVIRWTTSNTMLTQEEIQTYITKMREEQKKITLNKLDTLNVDDIQLMKDMKRIGLMKVFETQEKEGGEATDGNTQTPNEDQDGESEWLQETTDPEVNDDDTLSSIL